MRVRRWRPLRRGARVTAAWWIVTLSCASGCGAGLGCGEEDPPADRLDAGLLPVEANPLGQWVLVNDDERSLLYPTLVAFAVDAERLRELLPERIGPLPRGPSRAGVHEAEDAAVIAAAAWYGDPQQGGLYLHLEDTAWEPTRLGARLRCEREVDAARLADGRGHCVANEGVDGAESSSASTGSTPVPRIVAVVLGGRDAEARRHGLEAVPWEALRAEERRATRWSSLATSSLLGRCHGCEVLSTTLTTKLGPPEAQVIAEHEGFRREARTTVSRTATRVLATQWGPLQVTLSDLGPKGAEPVLAERRARTTSADEMRAGATDRGAVRCSAVMATCKWSAVDGERWLWTVTGPEEAGAEAYVGMGGRLLRTSKR